MLSTYYYKNVSEDIWVDKEFFNVQGLDIELENGQLNFESGKIRTVEDVTPEMAKSRLDVYHEFKDKLPIVKLHSNHFYPPYQQELIDILNNDYDNIIITRRKNLLEQCISWAVSMRTDLWNASRPDQLERLKYIKDELKQNPIRIERHEVMTIIERDKQLELLSNKFPDLNKTTLWYEDMSEFSDNDLMACIGYTLSEDDPVFSKQYTQKLHSASDKKQYVSNMDEILGWFKEQEVCISRYDI